MKTCSQTKRARPSDEADFEQPSLVNEQDAKNKELMSIIRYKVHVIITDYCQPNAFVYEVDETNAIRAMYRTIYAKDKKTPARKLGPLVPTSGHVWRRHEEVAIEIDEYKQALLLHD